MRNIIVKNGQTISEELAIKLINEAVQEATIALYNAIKTYDSQRSSFSTFASLCIKRAVISFVRKNGAQKNIPDEMLSSLEGADISDNLTPEEIIIEKEDYESLTQSIKLELSKMEFEVLQMFLAGMSYTDIAESLNTNEKAVDNALSRIRKKLKK